MRVIASLALRGRRERRRISALTLSLDVLRRQRPALGRSTPLHIACASCAWALRLRAARGPADALWTILCIEASAAADHFVNFWEKPTAPSEWKPEQATLIIFAGWASVIAFFTRGDGKDPTEKILEARCGSPLMLSRPFALRWAQHLVTAARSPRRYQALKEGKPLPGEKAEKGHGGHGKKEAHGHH